MSNHTVKAKYVSLIFAFAFLSATVAVAQYSGDSFYLERGRIKALSGRLAEAIEDFTMSINFIPNNPDAYNARGVAYEKFGDYAAARADYEQALRLNPNSGEAMHNLRNLEATLRAKNIALPAANPPLPEAAGATTWRTGPTVNPPGNPARLSNTTHFGQNLPAQNSAARSAAQSPRIPATPPYETAFRQTLTTQNAGQNTNGRQPPASLREQTQHGQTRTAAAPSSRTRPPAYSALNQLSFVDPVAESYNLQGTILNGYGRFSEAVSQFNEAIKSYPEYAIAYNNRGVALANMGEFEAAAADFNQALRLNPYYRDAQFNRERINTWTARR